MIDLNRDWSSKPIISTQSIFLDQARRYVDMGWSVIPIVKGTKKPAVKSWKEYQERIALDEELVSWFASGINGIGIVTGSVSNLCVVDFDTQEAVEMAHKLKFPVTPCVKTGKGYHAYCQYREGLRNFQKRDDLPGIDLRAEGGYVLAPPTVHPSGAIYEWVEGKGLEHKFAEVPDWVIASKKEHKTKSKDLIRGAGEGSRNDSLAKVAGSVIQRGMSYEEAVQFCRAWNQQNDPPLPEMELQRTVRSIFDAHQRNHPAPPVETRLPEFKCMAELVDKEFAPINWAVQDLLPEGLAVLSGPPKLGKSWLSLDMCLNIATGGMVANQFCTDKGSVLLCALEDNDRRLKSRLKMRLGAGFRFPTNGMLDFNMVTEDDLTSFFYTTEMPPLDMGGMEAIKAFLDIHPDCKLIVLDTLAKVKPAPKKNSGNAYETDYKDLGELQRLALDRHCCIMVITHNRKTETDDALQSISGSTGITGVMDTIMIVKRGRNEKTATLFVTGRDVSEKIYTMTFDGDHGAWTVIGEGDVGVTELQTEILAALEKGCAETGRGMKPKQLWEYMGGEVLAPKEGTIRQVLKRKEKEGFIHCHNGAYAPKL